jgi:tRNA-dihydrouridine synthase B
MSLSSLTAASAREPKFHIGTIPVLGDQILAPMDGLSDWPFRSICRAFGSALSYTAFVAAHDVLAGRASAFEALHFTEDERPVVAQLFDDDEDRLLAAALRVRELGPDVIDVNMGCSARCVSGRGAGAGLLQDPAKIGRIMGRLSRALDVPVTAKIRLGWDDRTRNYLVVARAVEDNGGALIAIHGRTRSQAYRGEADWEAIASVKSQARIPVLGNGDITGPDEADRRLRESGCDGVLIGRAALGNPWIFAGHMRGEIRPDELGSIVHLHLGRMIEFHGPERGVVLFRKHLARYLDGLDLSPEERAGCLTEVGADSLRILLESLGLPAGPPPALAESGPIHALAA